jgi:N-acetylglucosamine PTS system EIICBA or EIICB component
MNFFGYLQKLGKAMMTPVAVLPAAGILLRLGQEDLLNIKAIATAGDAIFSNLPLLFAIGVAIGLASDAGVAGLSAMVAFFVMTKTATVINADINMGVLAGIISGAMAAAFYNRYKGIQLPQFLGFFGGKRFVPIVTSFAALILGVAFGYVWPPIQNVIHGVGDWIVTAGAVGLFIYGVLNRLLIPLGLHHILNSMVWFVFGSFTPTTGGQAVHGDLTRFFKGDTAAGGFMTGFFPVMMFGLAGAALAMYQEAKPAKKKMIGGIMLSAALTSFLTGITEPLEFAFMFISPVLYGIHAVLTGLAMAVTSMLGIKLGFTFSAGAIDYVLNYTLATNPIMALGVGVVFFALYWGIFRFAIRRFNLVTPGREADEEAAA